MSKTLIVGDPHLGKSTITLGKTAIGSSLNSRLVDQLNILEWILNIAISENISNLVLTGDIFDDRRPSSTIISLFITWLNKVVDNDINISIIMGNHDSIRSGVFQMSALDIIASADIEGVSIIKSITTLHTLGSSFTLIPFSDRRSYDVNSNAEALSLLQGKLPYELAEIDNKNAKLVIGHLAIEGSLPVGDEIDDATNEIFCPIEMFKGYDAAFLGHIHKYQIMSKTPFVSHIGSMDISDYGEQDHKKVIVIFDPNGKDPYRYLEIPTRPLRQVSITVPEDIIDTTSYVIKSIQNDKKSFAKSIVKLNILMENPNTINIDRPAVEKSILDLGAFHISRINEERRVAPIKKSIAIESIDNTVNENTAIKMFADANIDDESKNDFIALANEIVKECSSPEGKV
jgi:DNA repair exonuclease SbcCD nuclease subunit